MIDDDEMAARSIYAIFSIIFIILAIFIMSVIKDKYSVSPSNNKIQEQLITK